MRVEVPFDDWIVAVLDPTVEDPWPPPAQDLAHLTRLFSEPVTALEGCTDGEIGIGLSACRKPRRPTGSFNFRARSSPSDGGAFSVTVGTDVHRTW